MYEAGNDYKTVAKQFDQLISMSPGGQVTLDSLTEFRSVRFDTQIGEYSRLSNRYKVLETC